MTLLENMRSDLDAIYLADEFAEDIQINGMIIRGIVSEFEPTAEQSLQIRNIALTVTVRVSEIAEIDRNAIAVVRGTTCRVIGDPLNDRLEWSLELTQDMVNL